MKGTWLGVQTAPDLPLLAFTSTRNSVRRGELRIPAAFPERTLNGQGARPKLAFATRQGGFTLRRRV